MLVCITIGKFPGKEEEWTKIFDNDPETASYISLGNSSWLTEFTGHDVMAYENRLENASNTMLAARAVPNPLALENFIQQAIDNEAAINNPAPGFGI